MLAEKAEPQSPQGIRALQHDLDQTPGMRAGVIGQRQLQDVFEIGVLNRKAPLVREAVGIKRDQRACRDREQPEADPGDQKRSDAAHGRRQFRRRLDAGHAVDDPSEQHGFRELNDGERKVGDGEGPAHARLWPEKRDDAGVKPDK